MRAILVITLLGLSLSLPSQPQIALNLYASGFSEPVDITHAGDERLFVVQQNGIIRIIDGDGTILPTPFLDITDRVLDNASERGLLGLAFHPDYALNGYFYVNYTGSGGHNRVSRFSVTMADPDIADPDSELILLTINQPQGNHNGGDVSFGPDGYLYTGIGDGGGAGDVNNNAQNPDLLLGKMLRIDVDNPDAGLNYGIPPDNPYAAPDDGVADEIWALGLRNPWRFSFDRETGDMWIGDVGQNAWEEVDFQPADSPGGENYGWRCYEGNHPFNTSGCGPADNYVFPIHEYSHAASNGCSITGGFVYRGCEYPGMLGYYFYVDYCTGQFSCITSDGAGGWETYDLINGANLQFVGFGEDVNGALYVAALGQGRIYKIEETAGPYELAADIEHESCEGAANGSITLNWPEELDPVSVLWENGGTDVFQEELSAGTYQATLTAGNGCTYSNTFEVVVEQQVLPVIEADGWLLLAPGGYISYQWYLDGAPITGAEGSSFVATEEGDYQVEVTDEAGCVNISEAFSFMFTSTDEKGKKYAWNVSPNPFTESIQLEFGDPIPESGRLYLLDAFGRRVENLELSPSTGSVSWSLENLPSGLYWLVWEHTDGVQLARLIKQ